MVDKFIKRPVLSTVLSIVIFLIGLLGLASLPITQFPEIAPPMVEVSASYMGASADVVLKSVVAPLEEQINGVENMTYMTSTADNNGSATIKVYFSLGTDADLAAVNVQNRVAAATSKLPSAVIQYGIKTQKSQNSMLLMVSLYSDNPDYDETFVENFARINVYPELQRVNGVGMVSIFGMRDYAMRVWLQPEKLASYNLMPQDVLGAIQEQNLEAAPGKFGDNTGDEFTYTIRYKGKFTEPSQYENIVIKALSDGRILRLKDVARLELGAFSYGVKSHSQGKPAVGMAIYQMAGTNARQIVNDIKVVLENSSKTFPAGIKYSIPYDTNKFLDSSIEQVIHTFFEAFILVFLVVYVFLQNFRSTLIPGIASLVAIVGTFFFLLIMGFTINILTLFALVLAIGMVVDDAIVVVEAVHAKMHEGITDVKEATRSAMSEITGAIISITFVMSAVFLPVTFMSGPTGVFYNQFAMTLAIAILISAVNALTLSPVLCTLLIKPPKGEPKRTLISRFHTSFDVAFASMTAKYTHSLKFLFKRKYITVLALAAFGGLAYFLLMVTPSAFIPSEDQGVIFADVTMPAGTSRERTDNVLRQIDSIASSMPIIENRMTISGVSLMSGANGGAYGLLVFSLKDWADRPDSTISPVLSDLYRATANMKEGRILFFTPPTVSGFSVASGFELQLQDRSGKSIDKFAEVTDKFMEDLSAQPEIASVSTSFDINYPQEEFEVNVDKCKLMGVNVSDVFNTMQIYYGSAQASDFNRFTKYYRVMVQSDASSRENKESLSKIMVRNNAGVMVPINTLVSFKRIYGAESLKRFNLFTAATINGTPAEGYSSGDAIAAVERVAAKLPTGYGYEFSGMTREEKSSGGQSAVIFLLCFIFVYLILSAQYESYILPWAVMLSLIIGVFGVYFFVWLVGLDNNIYVQVALIMLIGLLAKNGILIVEFALQRRSHGLSIVQAAKEGAEARLRPILMTSFAFIFGMIPLILSSGAGAAGNVSIGVAAAGGMLIGTLFGVFMIPVLFTIFRQWDEKVTPSKVPEMQTMQTIQKQNDED
ncbi:MAG: efflux RND transporter permease subunit [Mucinivorans sp.]